MKLKLPNTTRTKIIKNECFIKAFYGNNDKSPPYEVSMKTLKMDRALYFI